MDTLSTKQVVRVCPKCSSFGFIGPVQPRNHPPNQVTWCDCRVGQCERAHWEKEYLQRRRAVVASLFTDSCIPVEYESATIDRLLSLKDGDKAAAIAAATELIDTGEVGGKNSLCVIGEYGVGKTYLLSAVLRTYLDGGESGLWLALAELFRDVQRGYSQGNDMADQRIDAACNAGVLMIDDFGRVDISGMETTDKVRIIDTIINYRHNMRKPTLITSNLGPDGWAEQFGRRTADRVYKMCAVVRMGGQNLRLI